MLDLLSLSYNNINYKYNKLTKGQQKKEKKIEHERTCEQPTSVVPIPALFSFLYFFKKQNFKNICRIGKFSKMGAWRPGGRGVCRPSNWR